MRKRSLVILILSFLGFFASPELAAQKDKKYKKSKTVKIADHYYDNYDYANAIIWYRKAIKEDVKDAYATFKLAETYFNIYDYVNAERWYGNAFKIDPEHSNFMLYKIALTLKINGRYEKSKKFFERYIQNFNAEEDLQEHLDKAKFELEGCDFALEQLAKGAQKFNAAELQPPVNSRYGEYGAYITPDGNTLTVTTSRAGTTGNAKDQLTGAYHTDILRFEWDTEQARWKGIRNLDKFNVINSPQSEGAGIFNKNQTAFYFTRCGDGGGGCQIYVSKKKGGKFTAPKLLNDNINDRRSDSKQPALTPGEDTLFFVSDRKGGYGARDIWYSVKDQATGEWGEAMNLGPNINTAYNEVSPFYFKDENALFFSTNGRAGFGSYDVYMAYGKDFESIVNIGLPFNSNRDDIYFTIGKEKAFFTSNRGANQSVDNIYEAWYSKDVKLTDQLAKNLEPEQKKFSIISSLKYDGDSDEPAISAPVILIDDEGNEVARGETDESGNVKFENLPTNKNYKVVYAGPGDGLAPEVKYYEDDTRISAPGSEAFQSANSELSFDVASTKSKMYLGQYKSFSLIGRLDYKGSSTANLDSIPVQLIDDEGNIIKTTFANAEGKIRFENLPTDSDYQIKIDANRLPGVDKLLSLEDIELKGSKILPNKTKFEDVLFDFNSAELSKESIEKLDQLASFYKQYPNVQIEMSAYTDSKGSKEYNTKLAQRRGNAALAYLVSKGVDRSALVVNAMGAANFVASNDTEEGRALNRRVEFLVVDEIMD